MVTMYDSIEVAQIPASAQAVAGYVGGKWPTYRELVKRFPASKHLSIAVNSSEDAECLDIEAGDATPQDAPGWFARQRKRKVDRPCFYCSLSVVDELHRVLVAAGIQRGEYRLWVAHYTGVPHVCGPSEGIGTAADATQWSDRALGRNLDVSLCTPVFFGTPDPPSKYQPDDELNWCREWDRIRHRTDLAARLRRLFLRHEMLRRRKEITRVAARTGWSFRNRLYRYRQLQERTG